MSETITCQECGVYCLTYESWAEHNSTDHPEEYMNVVQYTEIFEYFWQYEQKYGFETLKTAITNTDWQEDFNTYLSFRDKYKEILEQEKALLN